MKTIALHYKDNSIEAQKLSAYCTIHNIPIIQIKENTPFLDEYIPCGSVEWISSLLNTEIIPDYYPYWLNDHLYRKVWQSNKWILGKKLFVKPADRYKRFDGFITTGFYRKKKKPPYWYSKIVKFTNEWRYYIANGETLCGEWYSGDEINTPSAPKLNIKIPEKYCGALDFGTLSTGELALVEAQHPFACGWYGVGLKDIDLYIKWLEIGWEYMKKRYSCY